MEEMIRAFKSQLDEVASVLTLMSGRLNKLCDTSSCQGDLCSCITFYKGMETQMREILLQMKQKDHEDKARDKRLEQLSQDIANMRSEESVNKSQTAIPKTNLRKERADLEKRNKTLSFPEKSFWQGYRKDDKGFGERKDGSVAHSNDKGSDGEIETQETKRNSEAQAKTNVKPEQHERPRLKPNQDSGYTSNTQLPKEVDSGYGNISKPNFKSSMQVALPKSLASSTLSTLAPSQVGDDLPVVVEQTEKEYYLSPEVWDVEAKAEEISSQNTPLRELEDVTTILLIDTSQSMASGDNWRQVKTFVNDYIDGLEEMSAKHRSSEHVALVTFGAQTRCHQRYTKDLNLIRSAFNKLHLGGPSPLYGGLTMAMSVSQTCEKDIIVLENGIYVYTKIILITDGEPTEICLHRGPDIPDPKKMEEAIPIMLWTMEILSSKSLDLFCVPVGDGKKEFLTTLFAKEGSRRFLNYRDGAYFSRRLFLTTKFEALRNLFLGIKYEIPRRDPELTARDLAHMQEILEDANVKNFEQMKKKEQNPYEEGNNTRLLRVGSRVRRGPDWANGVEDDEGPGTVIGHNLYRDRVWVNWDKTDEIGQYSFGDMELYAVLPVDEPRILLPGQPLAVGCLVTTGKDWNDDSAPAGSKGVIIKMGSLDGIRKALVRWENGKKGIYSYGDDRVYEIIMCMSEANVPALSSTETAPAIEYYHQRPVIQSRRPGSRPVVPTIRSQSQPKNKNKNLTK